MELTDADAAVVPGVGAADSAMRALERLGLVDGLRKFVETGRPMLGVCLGQQLLMDRTEEGDVPCLGLAPGTAKRLPDGQKVPHMGWNRVEFVAEHPLLEGIPNPSYFYFVHSYYVQPDSESAMVGMTEYGVRFCSMLAKGSVVATQFHPEKSGPVGLRMYDNFVRSGGGGIRSNGGHSSHRPEGRRLCASVPGGFRERDCFLQGPGGNGLALGEGGGYPDSRGGPRGFALRGSN